MLLADSGLYSSVYDEESNAVVMCLLSNEFKMFTTDPGAEPAYVTVSLSTNKVDGTNKDKRAIATHLGCNVKRSPAAFLRSIARKQYKQRS